MSLTNLSKILFEELLKNNPQMKSLEKKSPVHVVYGGADRFSAETPEKLGRLALNSLETFAPNFVEFANAMWLKGCDTLRNYDELTAELEFNLIENELKVKEENFPAWFAWTIYNRTIDKLKREPIEDFRIDFEDGYGIRSNEEEDNHALAASEQLALSLTDQQQSTPFCGFRIKSFQLETYDRAVRTLEIFLSNLLKKNNNALPENFVVTLPKISATDEVTILNKLLAELENQTNLPNGSIKIELMIETPFAVKFSYELVKAAENRCISAHFGAYDYTASFGITAVHQYLKHPVCDFARNMMQMNLSPLGIRLSDSVTTEMPIPIHKGKDVTAKQFVENKSCVHKAWRTHFNNVSHSLINGFYQSWDLHPAQLVARYAAVYSFFLESFDEQALRLKSFMQKATKATLVGNQFDDAASAQGLLNYFLRGLSCGALTENEITALTDLTIEELKTASFWEIMKGRN